MLNLTALLTKIVENILPVTGGQMTGALKTSFQNSEIIGSKQTSGTTISALTTELSGKYQMGSVNLAEYTSGATKIPGSWYNYLSLGDMFLLFAMTGNNGRYICYNGKVYSFNNLVPSKGNMSNSTTTNYSLNGTAGTHYYYVRNGNVVTVNFNVKCTTASSSMTVFASGLPKHNISTGVCFPLACEDTGTYRPMWAQINEDGTISGMLGTAGKYFYGSACYITYQ